MTFLLPQRLVWLADARMRVTTLLPREQCAATEPSVRPGLMTTAPSIEGPRRQSWVAAMAISRGRWLRGK